jgi:transcriptional regulator with XRE-family HTH domain
MTELKQLIAQRFTEVLSTLKSQKKIKGEGQLATDNGYAISNMTQIKAGQMNPPDKILNYLEKNFNVNIDYILTGEGEMFGRRQELREEEAKYEPKERIYLVESVHNLTQSSKAHAQAEIINAKNIERLIGLLELQYESNLQRSAVSRSTFLDPGLNEGSEGFRPALGKRRKPEE